jgi:hypothetical protein
MSLLFHGSLRSSAMLPIRPDARITVPLLANASQGWTGSDQNFTAAKEAKA